MRFFLGFLGVVGLIILVFVLIFNLSGDDNGAQNTARTQTALTTYANSTKEVRFIIDGPIRDQTTHQSIRMNVGQNQSTLSVLTGYTGTVSNGQTYENNQQSYLVFLKALEKSGFNKGNEDPALGDERGTCPLGRRYIMEVWDGGTRLQHLWTTNCRGGGGTFEGNLNQVINLFQRQYPDYGTVTTNVNV